MVPASNFALEPVNPACVAFSTYMSLPPGASISWSVSVDAGVNWGQASGSVWVNFSALGQKAYLQATVTNSCGSYSERFIFECVSLSSCGLEPQFAPAPELKMLLSPNPVKTILYVELEETKDKTVRKKNITEVQVRDHTGAVRFTKKFNAGQGTIPIQVAALINGMYTIMVSDGKQWVAEKFIKH